MNFVSTHLIRRFKALFNSGAWILIVLGLFLFSVQTPFAAGGWINLPVAATVFQTAGLVFMLFGLQIIASIIVWPQVDMGRLLTEAMTGNRAAANVLLGLMIFNGLSMIALVLWLSGALGAGVVAK